MIKSIEARYFRKHEDLKLNFTGGLNVLRGPNEIGKTTITEIFLYCFFGTSALVDKLEDVVTWGHKEAELKAKTVVSVSGIDYVFARSKAGAEVTYAGEDGNVVRVTGQKEVTSFAGSLLGADAKTASVLMLSSQAGLRGALDEGATAVGALMGKLADFDTIDTLLQNAAATLALGSIVPVQEKLAAADLEVLAATGALLDPAALASLDEQVAQMTTSHAAALAAAEVLTEALTKADVARDEALANNVAVEAAARKVGEVETALRLEQGRLDAATADVAKRPGAEAVEAARVTVFEASMHAAKAHTYAQFLALPMYPDVAWDDTQDSFDEALAAASNAATAATDAVKDLATAITLESRNVLVPGAACKSCGHKSDDPAHMAEHNAAVASRLEDLQSSHQAATIIAATEHAELNEMLAVKKVAQVIHAKYDAIRSALIFDSSCYPAKVSWSLAIPGPAPNVAALQSALVTLESQERLATQAEGRAAAHTVTVAEHQAALARASAVAASLKAIDVAPFNVAYDAAFATYSAHTSTTRDLGFKLEDTKAQRAQIARAADDAQVRLTAVQARVVEYVADIKALEFNNELVRKLKSMKPLITDHLWNQVLAAVGNYFSVLRGEQSIVTKDATGFRVNGRGGSLSGSTLDMLALSIRVALSKTFVPHANFMVLDEPAHGCDNVRASALLGFLSGVGFQQTILASHDELSESVADNVILLGG